MFATRKRALNRAAVNGGMPMSSSSNTAQLGMIQYSPSPHIQPLSRPVANPYQAPPMDYATAPTSLSLGYAASPYPPELPPPYPGDEAALQCPSPGRSYP